NQPHKSPTNSPTHHPKPPLGKYPKWAADAEMTNAPVRAPRPALVRHPVPAAARPVAN
ncbi:hypothetical protein RJZ57_006410, partial [Blastomyces gilchristii]